MPLMIITIIIVMPGLDAVPSFVIIIITGVQFGVKLLRLSKKLRLKHLTTLTASLQ
jgi:hypothetical protein